MLVGTELITEIKFKENQIKSNQINDQLKFTPLIQGILNHSSSVARAA